MISRIAFGAATLLIATPIGAQDGVLVLPGSDAPPEQRLRDAAAAAAAELGPARKPAVPRSAGFMTMMALRFRDDPGTYLFATPTRASTAVCRSRAASAALPVLQNAMAACVNALTRALKAERAAGGSAAPGRSVQSRPAATPSAQGTALAPPAHADNWAKVAGVYFRSIMTFGVGGMMYPDFEPVILFKDGSFYEPSGAALEDIDLAAVRASEPKRWGRWTGGGTSFTLTGAGRAARPTTMTLQDGKFFKAFPAEALGGKLNAKYTRVSGGGNSAMGGSITIGAQTDLTFAPDGTLNRAGGGGGFGPGFATSGSRRSGGSYAVSRFTIEMTGSDGKRQRSFFAIGSSGKSPQVDPKMIFIGRSVYVVRSSR